MLLAVDVGTSALKAVVYTAAGQTLAVATQRYAYATPQPGWAEGDPEAWWAAFCAATQALRAQGLRLDQLTAIAFTGQMHSAVLLDAGHTALSPTILWLDRRAHVETELLQQRYQLPPYQLNSTYTLPKLLWLRRHRPDVLERTAAILWPKDYLRFRLSGLLATDLTECGGAALLDWPTQTWALDRLAFVGLDASVLPPILPADAIIASPRPALAAELGLNPAAGILTGVGDVAALITGAPPRPGRVVCSLGSSSMVFMALAPGQRAQDRADRLYIYPFLPPYRLAGGVSSTTGAALSWMHQQFFGQQSPEDSFTQAAEKALAVEPGAEGLIFLPYLAGERSPYWSDEIRGGFYGLRLSHEPRHLARAVMEGVAFSLRHLLDIYAEMGLPVTELALAGGGANTPGLAQIIADACGHDAAIYTAEETVTRALYALCQQALGQEEMAVALERTFGPPRWVRRRPPLAPAYAAAYAAYRRFSAFAAQEAAPDHVPPPSPFPEQQK